MHAVNKTVLPETRLGTECVKHRLSSIEIVCGSRDDLTYSWLEVESGTDEVAGEPHSRTAISWTRRGTSVSIGLL